MGIELVTTAYGPPAAHALREVVARRKSDDALRPVTVVVSANSVGVAARRMLAGTSTAHGVGIAAVSFLTPYRLGELLGAPSLATAGRRPVSTPVLAAAVRRVLAASPGRFRAVASHPSTEEAFVRVHRELSELDETGLSRLERHPDTSARARDVVRVHRAVRALLSPRWFDERDLLEAATAVVSGGSPLVDEIGALVLHLPQWLSPARAALIVAVAQRAPATVVAGFTGVGRADAAIRTALARLGLGLEPEHDRAGYVSVPHGTAVLTASDADDEVRAAVRGVIDAARDGVPLERMAIVSGVADPYRRLAHDHLEAAGVPHHGSAVRTLAESVAGRTLLGLLDLPDRGFRRDDVVRVLAGAPLRFHGEHVPASAWERITRDAGVVAGLDQWDARLGALALRRRERAAERSPHDPEPSADRESARIDALRELVAHLGDLLDAARAPRTWSGWAALGHRLLDDLLPGDLARQRWPQSEHEGFTSVQAALDRLAGLDELDGTADLDVFRRTLRLELDDELGRLGPIGEGVLVGTIGLALGAPLERVFVVGLAEGLFPARAREDSLLTDDERRAAGGDLPLRAARPDDDERALLAVLAATSGERVLSYPRGDLRRSTERMPSRFLLDTVEVLNGTRVYGDGLARVDAPWCRHVASFASGVARARFPATEQEHRLRSLGRHVSLGRTLEDASGTDDPALARAVALVSARRSAAFTRYDGNLTHVLVPGPTRDGAVVSPTRLETYARSPHAYFMQSILRVGIPEEPEDRLEISPLDRGSLVHEVLEAFLSEVLARPDRPEPGDRWSASDRERLLAIAGERCDAYESAGRTGRALFWHRERGRVLADLAEVLDRDGERLALHHLAPIAAELRFGLDEPLDVVLGDGRVVRFRGAADRVDRAPDGSLVVIDYKSGRPYREPPADDVTAGGTHLQLPVYAHAARAAFGDADTPVTAAYWFVTARAGFAWIPVPLTAPIHAQVDRVLRAVVDAIEAGLFPCPLDPPGSWSWRARTYDDPDARGTRDRWREWERKAGAPELAAWFAIGGTEDA